MKNSGLLCFVCLLLLAAAITLACGSPADNRTIQSLTISPATATSEMQFIATGYYNTRPSPVAPVSATWGACYQGSVTAGVSVTSSGLAQCASGSSGAYTVWAYVLNSSGATCNAITPCGGGCGRVVGTAQLSCP